MGNMATENAAGNRILSVLDAGSFVEIGGAVTARTTDFNMQDKETPADGVVTGYGVVDGNLVYVYSQDASVLNGAIGEMHAKKIANIYDMAMKMGAPVIGMIDCAGLRLQEATDALDAFGKLYTKQALASGVIPQITAIFGTCGGGLSVVPALSDFTFMEDVYKRQVIERYTKKIGEKYSGRSWHGLEAGKCSCAMKWSKTRSLGIMHLTEKRKFGFVDVLRRLGNHIW